MNIRTLGVFCGILSGFFWGTMDCLLDMLYFDESNDTCLVKVKIAESVLERIFGIEEGSLHLSFPLIAGA